MCTLCGITALDVFSVRSSLTGRGIAAPVKNIGICLRKTGQDWWCLSGTNWQELLRGVG